MEPNTYQLARATARMRQAMGYYELGMIQHALACLDATRQMGDLGAFQFVIDMLRAKMEQRPDDYREAVQELEKLAPTLAPAYRRSLWMALSMCYRQAGDTERAVSTLAYARGASPSPLKSDE
jgi:Flp pilus assembly protein TadD